MPATRTARRNDTVSYRNAVGQTFNATVIADTKAPGAPASSTSTTGGTLAAATYSYRVTFVFQGVETAPSTAKTQVTTGATSTVTIDVTNIVPSFVTSWKVYGRTGGSELLMGTVTMPTKTFVDDGSATPSGALPTDTGNVSLLGPSTMANITNVAKASSYKQTNRYFNR
jgi:uncharacterized heparinase superfamily protein